MIGLVILASDTDPSEPQTIHIGYLLAKSAWGKGLASELVSGLVAEVKHHGPIKLVGGVDRSNPASARVLQKAGFALAPTQLETGTDTYIYSWC